MTGFLTNFCAENSLPITPLMKSPDNEDDVEPKFVYFVDLKELRI